jgi:site-specific DNA-methyltransferase (adenine-specific)
MSHRLPSRRRERRTDDAAKGAASSTEIAVEPGLLFHADALEVCRSFAEPLFDLVYIDPPFNVGGAFAARTRAGEARGRRTKASGPSAYLDAWGGRAQFLTMLRPRLAALRALMKPEASMWLHLDYRTVHYAKVMCDEIFGPRAFRGEIVWVPGNGARGRRGPSVTHQTLLIFSREAGPRARFFWNADDPALREPFAATSLQMHFRSYTTDGRAYRDRTIGGKTYRYFADQGRRLGSVWSDIPGMNANTPLRSEGTGYPTQKPERLLERIIRAASKPGHTVADLMCGSGTTLVVAARLGRRFVGGDQSDVAVATTSRRLEVARAPYRLAAIGCSSEEVESRSGGSVNDVRRRKVRRMGTEPI